MARPVWLLLLAVGCTGSVQGPSGVNPGEPVQTEPPAGTTSPPMRLGDWKPDFGPGDPNAAGVLPMRLLTRVEYNNTVRDLLGDTSNPANAFPTESHAETGFAKVQKLDDVNVGAYGDAAEALAGRATADLPKLLGCDPNGAAEDACVRGFVGSFGRRAYRRPLSPTEVAEHFAFYKDKLRGELKLSQAEAVRALVTGMLQSPHFLYRWELGFQAAGREGAVVRLGPHHLASQLSYLFWASLPDAELFGAADRDELRTPQQIEAQARRLLKDVRAARAIASFHEQWLEITNLPGVIRNRTLYPKWSPALGEAMGEEVRRFVSEVILKRDGRLQTLLTATTSFANGPLASLYGLSGGADWAPVTLPANRAGLFTLAGVMAGHADENEPSPILRGKFVREQVMCAPIPPPPGMIPDLPPPMEGVPKKMRYAQHSEGSCKGCHELMDPIGFGFESYDAIGAYRTMDGKFPVDATGTLAGIDGQNRPFEGSLELVKLLAASEQVRACVVRQWFRYAFARREGAEDDHTLSSAYAKFRASNYDIRELLVALATSRAFTHRTATADEEVTP